MCFLSALYVRIQRSRAVHKSSHTDADGYVLEASALCVCRIAGCLVHSATGLRACLSSRVERGTGAGVSRESYSRVSLVVLGSRLGLLLNRAC